MKKFLYLIVSVAILSVTLSATTIGYTNIGTAAPANIFKATTTGDIWAYFWATDASYDSTIGLLVDGVDTGVTGLPNHTSAKGASIKLGHAKAGDDLEFVLYVANTGSNWNSDPSKNGGENHVYSTPFVAADGVPAGIYVAFEDQPFSNSDRDYNDHQFVFTNASAVPEPVSFALVGFGLVAVGLVRRFRFSN